MSGCPACAHAHYFALFRLMAKLGRQLDAPYSVILTGVGILTRREGPPEVTILRHLGAIFQGFMAHPKCLGKTRRKPLLAKGLQNCSCGY